MLEETFRRSKLKKRKDRTDAEAKRIQEKERSERLNRLAAELEEKNDFEDDGIKIFSYPLPRADGERPSQVGSVSVKHGSRSVFRKLGNK